MGTRKGRPEIYGNEGLAHVLGIGTGQRPHRSQIQGFLHSDWATAAPTRKMKAGAFLQQDGVKGRYGTQPSPLHPTSFKEAGKGKEVEAGKGKDAEDSGAQAERGVFDPLEPSALMTNRAVLGVGAGVSYLLSLRLKSKIVARAAHRVDDKVPGNARIFEFGEERDLPRTGRRRDYLSNLTQDHNGIRVVRNQISKYDALMLTEPFYNIERTVLDDEVLWLMQCQLLNVAFTVALITVESTHFLKPVLFNFMKDLLETDHAINRLSTFAKIMGTFNAFFLGSITGQTLARWNGLWEKGFHKIGQAVGKVSAILEHDLPEAWMENETTGEQVVRQRQDIIYDISRWSRASVCLLFHIFGRSESVQEALRVAQDAELLTVEEAQLLANSPSPEASIWTWHHRLLQKLKKDGLTSADHSAITWDGWTGAYFVSQQLNKQLPYQFMHMLTAIVKSSNTLTLCVAGLQIGRALLMGDQIEALLELVTNMLLPLINNSILIFSMNLANPMSEHFTSWSEEQFDADIDSYSDNMRAAMSRPPTSLSKKWELPPEQSS